MNKTKKIILLSLTIFLLTISGFICAFSSRGQAQVKASTSDTHEAYTSDSQNYFNVNVTKTENGTTSPTSIDNGSYVLLNLDDETSAKTSIDFSISSLQNSNKYLTTLYVNAYLNGEAIDVSIDSRIDPSLQNLNSSYSQVMSFNFKISRDNPPIFSNTKEEASDLQGHYEFEFRTQIYDTKTNSIITSPTSADWYLYEFTIIDEENYSYNEKGMNQELQLSNVDAGVIGTDTYYNNYSYFDSNNTTKFGYADISFDPERFKLIYTKTYDGKITDYETNFAYYTSNDYSTISKTQTDYGKLSFVSKEKSVSFNLKRDINSKIFYFKESNFTFNSSSTTNYTMPLFYDLGEYSITPYYQVYQNGELLYDKTTNSPVAIPSKTLIVYGFNLNYAYNITQSDYFTRFNEGNKINEIVNESTQLVNNSTDITPLVTEENVKVEGTNIHYTKINKNLSFESTNQAPIWFNSNVSNINSLSYVFDTSKDNLFDSSDDTNFKIASFKEKAVSVTKNSYFTNAGYYIVKCEYTPFNAENKTTTQYFAFQIKNSTPQVSIYEYDTNTKKSVTLNSGSYSNKAIYISVDSIGIFDSEVKTSYCLNSTFTKTFKTYTTFTPSIVGKNTDYTIFDKQGVYSVKVQFGVQSVSYYTFTIDKTDISNFVRVSLVDPIGTNSSTYVTKENVTGSTILNKDFTLAIQEKPSGAQITAQLTTFDITTRQANQSDVYETGIGENIKTYIKTNYVATYASSPSSYTNIVSKFSTSVSSSYVFTEHKIYIFEINDEAGFNYVYIVYLDKSNVNILQFDSSDQLQTITDYNIVSSKTTAKWAQYKALQFLGNSEISGVSAQNRNNTAKKLLMNSNYFVTSGLDFLLLEKITNVEIKSTDLDGEITANSSGDLYGNYQNSSKFTVYGQQSEANADGITTPSLYGEKIYNITLTDESGNKTNYKIEVNMDKSLGKAFTTDKYSDFNYRNTKLDLNDVASLDYLIFEWKNSNVDNSFEIASITYSFYDLTYNTSSKNFPYSETVTEQKTIYDSSSVLDKDYYLNTELDSKYYYSTPLNTISTTYKTYKNNVLTTSQKYVTKPGKYVITRTYSSYNTASGDTLTKDYIYYVDRNPILDYPQSGITSTNTFKLGNGINLSFGDNTFNEFYRESSSSISIRNSSGSLETLYYTIETNFLPITIKVPQSKYSYLTSTKLETKNSIPKDFNLTVVLERYSAVGQKPIETIVCSTVNSDGYIEIPQITARGYYRLYIYDGAKTKNEQISPAYTNTNYFAFYVNLSGPEANIKSSNSKTITSGEILPVTISGTNYYYTIDTSVSFKYYNVYQRSLDTVNPNLNTAYKIYQPDQTSKTLSLPICGTDSSGNFWMYQYKIILTNSDNEETIVYSPLYTEYNEFSNITNDSATKDNYVVLIMNEPTETFTAEIDYNDISIVRATKNGSTYGNGVKLKSGTDYILQQRLNPENKKSIYSILLYDINRDGESVEYKYTVSYHFKGNASSFEENVNGVKTSYYSNTLVFYVDKSAPNANITRLANSTVNDVSGSTNATLLAQNGLSVYTSNYYQEINETDSNGDVLNSTYYYANVSNFDFAISGNFEFNSTDAVRLYVRKIENKYIDKTNSKSIQASVPGDSDYKKSTSSKLRFTPADSMWSSYELPSSTNTGITFEKLLDGISKPDDPGYYEIIEMDSVGNYTIYTVLYKPTQNSTLTFAGTNMLSDKDVDKTKTEDIKNVTASITELSSYNNISLTNINFELNTDSGIVFDAWSVITVNGTVYNITPSVNLNDILEKINTQLSSSSDYTITMTDRFNKKLNLKVYINRTGAEFAKPIVTPLNDGASYQVTFESNHDGLKMKSLTAFKFNSATHLFEEIPEYLDISKENRTYELSPGIYKFYIEDNLRQGSNATVVYATLSNDLEANPEFKYSSEIKQNGITYTFDNVTLIANEERYIVTATRDGTNIDVTFDENNTFIFTAPTVSPEASVVSGGSYEYVVTITDMTTDSVTTSKFIIYNLFPAVKAYNSNNEDISSILATSSSNVSTFTSESVLLQWNTSNYKFGYTFTLKQYTRLPLEGEDLEYKSKTVSTYGVTVLNKGAYELVCSNKTINDENNSNSRSYWFIIRENSVSMYSISEKLPSGSPRELEASSELLEIPEANGLSSVKEFLTKVGKSYNFGNTLKIKNFFSIYDFEILVDKDKGLSCTWGTSNEITYSYSGITGVTTKIVIVYGFSPYNYLDIFAVTKVNPNSRFLETIDYSYDSEEETVTQSIQAISFSNITVYENPITISWPSYYITKQNKITMTYEYNGRAIENYSSETDDQTTTLNLIDDGTYVFKFVDLAGNCACFGDASYQYFTLIIKSKVDATVNEKTPIFGAVYNSDVTLTIPNIKDYQSITIDAYLNGSKIKNSSSKTESTYNFTDAGFYKIYINGVLKTSTTTSKTLQTNEIVFTIINPNESKFAYEFASINGYTITKVTKNDYDITNSILGSSSAIYSLVLSESTYGVGKFSITVNADFVNSLQESETFSFDVWINNKTPSLNCNIEKNEVSTNDIVFTYNAKALYEQLGECKIVVGNETVDITAEQAETDANQTLTITKAGTYYVQLVSSSGNIISVYKVTKQDPLNPLSIILIIITVIIVITLIILFYRLRIKMKIK